MIFEHYFDILLVPISIIIISLILGIFLNRIIFYKLLPKITQPASPTYIICSKALRGIPIAWSLAIGLYWAINSIEMMTRLQTFLSQCLIALLMFSTTIVIARIVVGMIELYTKSTSSQLPATSILTNLIQISIYILGILIILQSFGISVAPLVAALGVGGLAVALGLQDTLANIFSGLHLILSKQLKLGDFIRLSTGEEGKVTDITWRFTTIQASSNNVIIVPNQKIASAILTNYNMPIQEVTVVIPMSVSYNSDLNKVESVTLAVANKVMSTLEPTITDFSPGLSFHTLGQSSIDFNVILRSSEFSNQFKLKHEFIKAIIATYRQENIIIPYPTNTIIMEKDEAD